MVVAFLTKVLRSERLVALGQHGNRIHFCEREFELSQNFDHKWTSCGVSDDRGRAHGGLEARSAVSALGVTDHRSAAAMTEICDAAVRGGPSGMLMTGDTAVLRLGGL